MVSDIPAGDGKTASLFLSVQAGREMYKKTKMHTGRKKELHEGRLKDVRHW